MFRQGRARAFGVAALVLCLCADRLPAQTSSDTTLGSRADTVRVGRDGSLFTSADAWLALGFVAGTLTLTPIDHYFAAELQDSSLQAHAVLRRLSASARFLGFPGSAILGASAYLVGQFGDMPRLAAIGLHGTEAIVVSYAFVWAGKNLVGRARPDRNPGDPFSFSAGRGFRLGDSFQSFPSGHTAAAFAAAAAVTAETRLIWPDATSLIGPILYTGAVLVGVSRMYHNRHWASDVVAGAAIGTFSGLKVVRYHYGRPDNPIDRWLLPTAVVPASNGVLLVWVVPAR